MDPRLERIKKELGDHFAMTEEAASRAKREYLEGDRSRIEAERQLLKGSGIVGLLKEIRDNRIVMFSRTAPATVEVIIPTASFVEVEFRQHATVSMVFNDTSYTNSEGIETVYHDQVRIQAVDGVLYLEVQCNHISDTPDNVPGNTLYYKRLHPYDLQVIDPTHIDDEIINAIKSPFKYSPWNEMGYLRVKK